MIVDTSAIVAVWQQKPGWQVVLQKLRDDPQPHISTATIVELGAVLDSRTDPTIQRRLDALLAALNIVVLPFDHNQVAIARAAYRDFGKGSGHRAKLNLGDCFAYALATARREPLLFVGDDFTHTDVTPA